MQFEERPEFAQRLLIKKKLSNSGAFGEAASIIRYLRYIGKSEEEVEATVKQLLKRRYATYRNSGLNKYYTIILGIANRLPPIRTDTLYISKGQIDLIHSLDNPLQEDFVFAALCLYLYYRWDGKRYLVAFNDVIAVAHLRNYTKVAKIWKPTNLVKLVQFKNRQYVELSADLLNIQDDDGITLDNFVNLCYYYWQKIEGTGYFHCLSCGCIEKQGASSKKWCAFCWRPMANARTSRYRERLKEKEKRDANSQVDESQSGIGVQLPSFF